MENTIQNTGVQAVRVEVLKAAAKHFVALHEQWLNNGGNIMGNKERLIDADALVLENSILMEDEYGLPFKCVLEEDIRYAPTVKAIVLPVDIGQILWCNIPNSEFPLECRVYCICREERNGLVLDYFRCAVKGWFGKAFSFEDIGKTVFLTEAEALTKMDG